MEDVAIVNKKEMERDFRVEEKKGLRKEGFGGY